ncbi:hypothetical protein N7922_24770 (plasmid) [Kosakonia sp. ML.JS2a]|uniref:hypothetical protein n=1 Tax=Kosakonia sp. ML.JS2a TaxID=2980557 RepID=UPI0021DAB80A|nr:hypothetical protein [Kosakonia sp. ML.JS2a]UXY13567.1 hypothetical protein N7922_24770 [Kosakonia sp. ML.JS2a]
MQKDPDLSGAEKRHISSVRHSPDSDAQLKTILSENPLYNTSVVIRGAILALFTCDKTQREEFIRISARTDP